MAYTLDWSLAGGNGSYTVVDGGDSIDFSIVTSVASGGQTATAMNAGDTPTPGLWVDGLTDTVTSTITFDDPVANFSFEIYDLDQNTGSWDDQITIIAVDAQGNQTTVNFSDLDGIHSATGNVLHADGMASSGVETSGADDSVTVSIVGPISSLQFVFDNGESEPTASAFGVGNITFEAAVLDEIVEGTSGGDLITLGYAGDPEGDRVDEADNAAGNDDDYIEAGDGDDTIYSGFGDDTVFGGAGDEYIEGSDGNDNINGGLGADSMAGSAGNDTISGDDGDDALSGGIGNDDLSGGAGNDNMLGDDGDDVFSGGDGSDSMYGGAGADTIYGDAGDDYVEAHGAGSGADVVYGGDDADIFLAGTDDTIDGGEGGIDNDRLNVTDVNFVTFDVVNSENGTVTFNDTSTMTFTNIETVYADGVLVVPPILPNYVVEGTSGDDSIDASYVGDPEGDMVDANDNLAGTNADFIEAGNGSDTVFAGAGDDVVFGGYGPDKIWGSSGADTLYGEVGNDSLYGGAGYDSIEGGAGDDTIQGNDGYDTIDGGEGNDSIRGNDGKDSIHGGLGNDSIDAGNNGDTVYGGEGDDTIGAGSGYDLIYGDEGADSLQGNSGDDTIYGGDGNDTISAGSDNDTVEGGQGDDLLYGGQGNDVLNGGVGDDIIWGGEGDDTIIVENDFGNDTILAESGSETNGDTLDLSAVTADMTVDLTSANAAEGSFSDGTSTATFNDVENIVLGGGADTIVLADGSGADLVNGFNAPDDNGDGTFDGNDLLDVTGLTSDGGTTPVTTADVVVTDDGGGNAVLTFTGGENITLVGIAPGDANNPAYLLAIGIPSDGIISGTSGDDFIHLSYTDDPDGDVIDGNDAGAAGDDDIVEAGAGNDIVSGELGDDLIYGGDGNDTIYGGVGDDTISGGAGDDLIFIMDGDEVASGGDDSDMFTVVDGFVSAIITGGEGGATNVDTINLAGVSTAITVTFSGDKSGTITDGGGNVVSFSEIERILLQGNAENVSLVGDSTGIEVVAGGGNDTILGGSGTDVIYGDGGDDIIHSGAGDTIYGGDGDDTIYVSDLGGTGAEVGTIIGGEIDETGGDTLDFQGLTTFADVTYSNTDPGVGGGLSGTAILSDGSTVHFSEIETVIICFTVGTRIATPQGARMVQDLRPGDLVVTRDSGLRPVRWAGMRTVPARGKFAPIRFAKGALGNHADLLVSPQHRMLMHGTQPNLMFGTSEVLVAAKHLVNGTTVCEMPGPEVTYVHILFDQHEIIYAEGTASESFFPGKNGLDAVDLAAREELFALFPELRSSVGNFGATARMCLRAHEGRLLRLN